MAAQKEREKSWLMEKFFIQMFRGMEMEKQLDESKRSFCRCN